MRLEVVEAILAHVSRLRNASVSAFIYLVTAPSISPENPSAEQEKDKLRLLRDPLAFWVPESRDK